MGQWQRKAVEMRDSGFPGAQLGSGPCLGGRVRTGWFRLGPVPDLCFLSAQSQGGELIPEYISRESSIEMPAQGLEANDLLLSSGQDRLTLVSFVVVLLTFR